MDHFTHVLAMTISQEKENGKKNSTSGRARKFYINCMLYVGIFSGRDVQCILHVSKKGFRMKGKMVEMLIYWQA